MFVELCYLLAFVAGTTTALQAIVNSQLRNYLQNPMGATLISFLVGTAAIVGYILVIRNPLPTTESLTKAPWWMWLGGLFGAFYIWMTVTVAPRVGVANTFALVVAGQLAASVLFDHFGVLGIATVPINPGRIGGILLIAMGVILVTKSRPVTYTLSPPVTTAAFNGNEQQVISASSRDSVTNVVHR